MAKRRERSITFRSPVWVGLGELKAGIEKEINDKIKVFQDLGDNVYFLELATKADADFPSFLSSATTPQVMYRFSSRRISHAPCVSRLIFSIFLPSEAKNSLYWLLRALFSSRFSYHFVENSACSIDLEGKSHSLSGKPICRTGELEASSWGYIIAFVLECLKLLLRRRYYRELLFLKI